VLGKCWQEFGKRTIVLWMCAMLGFSIMGCSQPTSGQKVDAPVAIAVNTKPQVEEVSPPEVIQQLRIELDQYDPQVELLGVEPDETLVDTTVNLRLQVKDLPIYKDPKLGLGPHIHVLLDNQPYQTLYNASETLTFNDLSPGTHTVRAFAVHPWDESFKTVGALDQVTFNVFAPTQANRPDPTQPLLTYNNPQGEYGAEPIMLDYSVTLPNRKMGQKTSIAPWNVNVSLNGQSFKTSEGAPIYLKGFKPGVNWLKLELLDANGKPVANAFSETVRLITFKPNGQDTLSQLVRGELTAQDAERIVNRKISKRLTDQERVAQEEQQELEEQEALAAEAAAKRESAKLAVPAPDASAKKSASLESESSSGTLRSPNLSPDQSSDQSSNQKESSSESVPKSTSVRSLPSNPPVMQTSPKPAFSSKQNPLDKSQENREAQAKQEIPLWSKLKSSLFSNKTSSDQPNSARSVSPKSVSPKSVSPEPVSPKFEPQPKTENSVQPTPQVSPSSIPPKSAAPSELKLNPVKMVEPVPFASSQSNSPSPGSPLPNAASLNATSLNATSLNVTQNHPNPLEPIQKFLDFQPLDTEKLPVIQDKTVVEVPSRYLKKPQTLNESLENAADNSEE
jgi:hypothetical protein